MAGKDINLTLHSAHRSSPKWSIPNRIPPREIGKGMPGPGQYGNVANNTEKDKFRSSPKYSITSAGDSGKEWGVFPGPGQYPIKKEAGGRSFGFGSEARLQEVKRSRTPGPGDYEARGNLGGLQFSVSTRPTGMKSSHSTPGPGMYKPSYDQIFESSMKCSFGSSSRSELAMSKSPGPGQYKMPEVLGGNCQHRSNPRYTIAGKRKPMAVDNTPGPGPTATQFAR